MEVHLTPDVQAKLEQMAQDTGRPTQELLEDAVTCLFGELTEARETLDRRFDDLESSTVKRVPGDEALLRLGTKRAARRPRRT
jgi:hypothetical protein